MEFTSETRLAAPTVATGSVLVKAPPEPRRPAAANPLARLLPVVMVVAVVGMAVLYLRSGQGAMRGPMVMLFPVMMLVSLVGTVAYGARGASATAEINDDRREYLRYLAEIDHAAALTAGRQHESLHWRHPDPGSLWAMVGTRRMWERRPGDADFGFVRVGLGSHDLSTTLVMPEVSAGERDPVTWPALCRLMRNRSQVADLPVTVPMCAHPRIGVDGDVQAVRDLLRAVVCQLASLHSPRHLRIAVVAPASEAAEWDWLKWLPHHQHPFGTDSAGPARMSYPTLGAAEADVCGAPAGDAAHAIVLVTGDARTGMGFAGIPGVTVLAAGPDAPENAGLSVRIDTGGLSVHGDGAGGAPVRPDAMTRVQAETCARRLARYRPSAESKAGLETASDWAGLMGVDPTRLEPAAIWRTRDTRRHLRVPIGIADDGSVVELDLKEAARHGMGPHGLCVGATGSGKSEFLRTLTLGLVAAHPPDLLNLILVDFKGGATFLGGKTQVLHAKMFVCVQPSTPASAPTRRASASASRANCRTARNWPRDSGGRYQIGSRTTI